MLQAQVPTISDENIFINSSLTDSKCISNSPLNNLSPNFLNSIQITQSRMTSNLREKNKYIDYIIQQQPLAKICPKCKLWENWAKQSETALLKIQKDLIIKQERLRFVIIELKKQLRTQAQQWNIKEIKLIQQNHKIQQKLNKIIKSKQASQKQLLKLQNYINSRDQKQERIQKQNNLLKKQVLQKSQNSNILYPNYHKGVKVQGKSKLEQTLTDCSLFRDNRDQGQITDENKSTNSRNRNINLYNQQIKQCQIKNVGKQRNSEFLAFENQNLRSYNRVLLQKLNLNKRFGKY